MSKIFYKIVNLIIVWKNGNVCLLVDLKFYM